MKSITERQKLQLVAAAMGQQVESAQATTIQVFDTLDSQGANANYTFFEGCNVRSLPETNLSTNKLPYKNNLVIEYISIIGGTDDGGGFMTHLAKANWTLTIGNQKVLNRMPFLSFQQDDNNAILSSSGDKKQTLFVPRTSLVIPADTTFKVELNNVGYGQMLGDTIRVVIGGYGTIKGGTTY